MSLEYHVSLARASCRNSSRFQGSVLALTIGMFVGVVGVLSYRAISELNVPNHPDSSAWALQDFRDTVYFPVVAFLDGRNPYDAASYIRDDPVSRTLPLYLPILLIIHLPFGLLPYQSAEAVYYGSMLALTLLLAWMSLRLSGLRSTAAHVFCLAALILLTRPGQMNLLLGQVALQCVIATYVALAFARTRPWLAGLALAFASFKPSFGLPLAFLMLCRRDARAVLAGLGVAAGTSVAVLVPLIATARGVVPFVTSALNGQNAFAAQPFNNALWGPFRIDAPALVARLLDTPLGWVGELLVGLIVLCLAGAIVHHVTNREADTARERQLTATIICLAMLACVYHQTYDALLLTLPLTALVADRWMPAAARHPQIRLALIVLLGLPALNYLASATAIDVLGLTGGLRAIVTTVNSAAVFGALAIYMALALREEEGA